MSAKLGNKSHTDRSHTQFCPSFDIKIRSNYVCITTHILQISIERGNDIDAVHKKFLRDILYFQFVFFLYVDNIYIVTLKDAKYKGTAP